MVSMKVQGVAQFARTLRDVDPSTQRAVKTRILKKAAEPIRQRMEDLAPWEPGEPDIKDQIVIQAVRSVDDEDFGGREALDEDAAAVAVGPSKSAFYGSFVEFGTAPRGNHPGTPAQPFARPAFDERADAAMRVIQDEVWAQIRNAVNRSSGGRNL